MGLRDDVDRVLRGATDTRTMRTATGKKLLRRMLAVTARATAAEAVAAKVPGLERRVRDLEAVLARYTRDLT